MSAFSRRHFVKLLGAAGGYAAAYPLGGRSVLASAAAIAAHPSDDLAFKTAVELAQIIRSGEISSLELTDHFIARIERYDGALNAIVVRDFERARAAAGAADAALAKGNLLGPLHGLPMTIKESFNLAGLPTTWGFPHLANNIARSDSEMVRRFKEAGAHFMGKTNVPMALGDYQTYNEIYGTTNNPWDLERVPGGSSGGSAAALAAGLTGLDSGSDIGGSIRNPAHCCGIYGHKPTWGVVPPNGHALPGQEAILDLVVVGPLARSAEDLALAMDIVAGPDPLNAPGWQLDLPTPSARSIGDLRVAVWPDEDICPVDREIIDRIQEVADLLASNGAKVSDTARPDFEAIDGHRAFLNLLASITGAGVPDEVYEQNRRLAAALDPDDISDKSTRDRASVLSHGSWLGHDNFRTGLREKWRSFFGDWDLLLCPILPTTAFPHDHSPAEQRTIRVNDQDFPYWQQVFWAGLATVSYLPATVFPTGLSKGGLPIGLQAIGPAFGDRSTIEFARLLAAEIGGFIPPPGYEA